MAHARCATILLAVLAMALSTQQAATRVTKVELMFDRASHRRIGYIVTKVRAIDRKDDELDDEARPRRNATSDSAAAATGKLERSGMTNDEEHAGETMLINESPDTEAMETANLDGDWSNHEFSSTDDHLKLPPQPSSSNDEHSEPSKTLTIVKKVPEPYPVEKTIHVPIYKKITYPVEVPVPEPYPIEKEIPYPVKVYVKVPVKIPKPVAIVKESYYPVHVPVDRMVPHRVYVPDPYPVERKIYYEVKVPVPEPFPVERKVHYPVKYTVRVPQPTPVDKIVPYPVRIEQDRPVAIPVPKPFPVPVTRHVPFHVEKVVPYPVKVHVDNPVPVPVEKPVPVEVKVDEELPYPVEKEVYYPVEKEVPYPVHQHQHHHHREDSGDEKPIHERTAEGEEKTK